MQFLRKSSVWFSTALLSLFIFAGVITLSLNLALGKPDNLKSWLQQSKIYDAVIPSIIETTSKQTPSQSQTTSNTDTENALARPEVQNALKEAFTPAFIQTTAENIIDGTYNWLEGKTPKPDYQIDLSAQKKLFADKLGAAAQQRIASLPPCSIKNPPTSTDPFTINCQPPPNVSSAEIQRYIDQIANSDDFLPNETITADTTSLNPTPETTDANTASPSPPAPQVAWYKLDSAQKAPRLYKWVMLAPYIFIGIATVFALIIVFASDSKRRGLKTAAGSLISAGFLVGVGAALTLFVFNKLQFTAAKGDGSGIQKPLLDALKLASDNISKTQLYWGVGLIAAGIVILLVLWLTRPKPTFKDEKSKEVIEPKETDVPASEPEKPVEQKTEEPVKATEQSTVPVEKVVE